jgi:hypothetical protein
MGTIFKNLLHRISGDSNLNIPLVVEVRRIQMEREGFNTDHINWEHYTKVLEAKARLIKES